VTHALAVSLGSLYTSARNVEGELSSHESAVDTTLLAGKGLDL